MSFEAGLALFKSGDYAAAANQFREVVDQDKNDKSAWNALGICLSKTGDYSGANTCFENALNLDPGNETFKLNMVNNAKKIIKEEPLRLDDYEPQKTKENQEEWDRFSNKLSIVLAVIGFFFGMAIASFLMVMGGIASVFELSGNEMISGRSWLMMFLCFVGLLASIVRHKRYGSLILILTGLLMIISVSAFGLFPGALYIFSGYLIFRETGFDLHYFTDFKTDTIKKVIFTIVILLCLIVTISSLMASEETQTSVPQSTTNEMITSMNPSEVTTQPTKVTITESLSGIDDQSTENFYLNKGLAIFSAQYDGDSYFSGTLYNEKGTYVKLLFNQGGPYSGNKKYKIDTPGNYYIEIQATGPWTIKINQ